MGFVLGISGSPREGGNTDIMVKAALDAVKKGKGCETQFIRLQDLKLNFCKGCLKCKEKGRCIQKDGMQEIYDLIYKADGIVLGSPVYFASVSAQTKACMDRFIALIGENFESRLKKGKRALLLFAQGAKGSNTFKYGLKPLVTTLGWLGVKVVGTVVADRCEEAGDVCKREGVLKRLCRFAERLVE